MERIPHSAAVNHPRGLLLTVFIFVCLVLSEISLSYMTGIGLAVTTVRELVISNCIDVFLFVLLIILLKELGNVEIGKLFFARLPHLRDGLKLVSLGVVLHVPGFIVDTRLPTFFGHEGYVTFALLETLKATVFAPFIEETLFRGLCFGSIVSVSRTRAYLVSTLLFLLWHVKFIDLIAHGTINLTWLHAVSIVVVGLIASYIYEKTGALTLCIIFHSAGNAFITSRPFFMYLLDH